MTTSGLCSLALNFPPLLEWIVGESSVRHPCSITYGACRAMGFLTPLKPDEFRGGVVVMCLTTAIQKNLWKDPELRSLIVVAQLFGDKNKSSDWSRYRGQRAIEVWCFSHL